MGRTVWQTVRTDCQSVLQTWRPGGRRSRGRRRVGDPDLRASRASIILGPSKRGFVIKKIRFFPIFAKIVHANSLLRAELFPFSEDAAHQLPLGSAGGWVSGRLFAIAQRHAHEHLVFGRRQKLPELLIVTWSRTSGSASSAGSRSPPSSPPCCLRRLRLTR